ncbi:Tectonic-1 [Frankliniella fusca]|uniref:Tectonic-1 n=1 Tax=Frankliniella fusca TaxID=407009 RepID=A0AAE1HN28_9NEOP|nr:Tectonic-1 [Frankliniella fusca]
MAGSGTDLVFFGLLILCSEAVSQTSPSSVSSPLFTTERTCGVGNMNCTSYENVATAEDLPMTSQIYTQQTTTSSSTSQEAITLSPSTLPSENVTKLPGTNLETTTHREKKTSTSTSSPTASPVAPQPLEHPTLGYDNTGICACDLMLHSCDVNCCCDSECSPFQRTSFSHCQVEGYPPYDNRYCYATKLVFLNNSEHILEQTQNGAFCIVRSNLAGSVLYPAHSLITNNQEFDKFWARTHSLFWPEPSPELQLPLENQKPYKAGSPIWSLQNNQILPLELPVSGLTSSCSAMKSLSYLLPWSSQCARKLPTTHEDCEKISIGIIHQIQKIVRSPENLNGTEILEETNESCPNNICVPVKYFSCSGSSLERPSPDRCNNSSLDDILFGYKSGMCHGIIKELMLVLHHNGTAGLQFMEAYMWLLNMSVSMESSTQSLHQSFLVEFNWISENESAEINNTAPHSKNFTFSRSGNKGYIIGKPVIAGLKLLPHANRSKDATNESSASVTYKAIELSPGFKHWITLAKPDLKGMCNWSANQRHIVTFGEDLHVSCGVLISHENISSQSSCSRLKIRMLDLLLGEGQLLQNTSLLSDWRRMISVFGTANVSNPEEWIPLLLDGQTPFLTMSSEDDKEAPGDGNSPLRTCENVPLGFQLRIMHGFVGTSLKPQSKIFGASLKFTSFQDIGWACFSSTCFQGGRQKSVYLRIVSTVKFVDVSSPAVTRFAEPPAIHIHLPQDFFYPFMSIENSAIFIVHNLPLLFSALLFEFVLYL